jgi:hypothetical protein
MQLFSFIMVGYYYKWNIFLLRCFYVIGLISIELIMSFINSFASIVLLFYFISLLIVSFGCSLIIYLFLWCLFSNQVSFQITKILIMHFLVSRLDPGIFLKSL